jgi:His-Xaa-Ser system protein HxsD
MASIDGRQDGNRDDCTEDSVVGATDGLIVPAWVAGKSAGAVSISRDVYSRRAVLAAAYKLSDRCAVLVDTDGEKRWVLFLIMAAAQDPRSLMQALIKELDDQALRDQLEEQFGAVRTLIVAQAFSEGNLLDPERDDADHNADARGTGERR